MCLFIPPAVAERGSCVELYRQIYMEEEDPAVIRGERQASDAYKIFVIYFDARWGLPIARREARPIFEALQITEDRQPEVLEAIIWMMHSGQLCNEDGSTKSLDEAIIAIRKQLQRF